MFQIGTELPLLFLKLRLHDKTLDIISLDTGKNWSIFTRDSVQNDDTE